jgi:hypothetical protein
MMPDRTPADIRNAAIAQGRAMVHVIECVQVLLPNLGTWAETALLKLVIALYQHRLRRAIGGLPADWSEEKLGTREYRYQKCIPGNTK